MSKILYKIGDFSKLCKVTVKTLRYYDEVDLLKPAEVDADSGYRYYTVAQLKAVSDILIFKGMGFALEAIRQLVKLTPEAPEFETKLKAQKALLQQGIQAEKQKLNHLHAFLHHMKEGYRMADIQIKALPEVIVASMRVVIPTYQSLFNVVPAMGDKMRSHGAVCRVPEYCFNIYHDPEYKESDIDVEICEAVTDYCEGGDGVVYKKLEGVETAACIYHKGPYETLTESYSELFKWIEQNHYAPSDHCRESFIDGIWNKENPEDWLTEIQIPVQKN